MTRSPDDTLPEELELDTLEAFEALRSVQRLELMEILASPKTVKEAAEELGVPVTRLYYHLNVMLDHGIVRVVDERPKGALDERVFQAAGKAVRPSAAFMERYGGEGIAQVVSLAFRHAEVRFSSSLKTGTVDLQEGVAQQSAGIVLANLRLTEARLTELVQRLQSVQAEFLEDDGPLPVSFFHAVHRRSERSA